MRKHASFSSLARWALGVALTSLGGACERAAPATVQQLPSPAPRSAAAPVPPGETYALSNVRLRYDEQRSTLLGSYEVRNRGTMPVRALLCVDHLDKDGYFVKRADALERISLGAGESDLVVDEEYFVAPGDWKATEVLRLYILEASSCTGDSTTLRSAVLWLDKKGQPLPAGERPEGKESEEGATGATFRLEDARLSQQGRGEVRLSYRVTNLIQGRASGTLCVRLTNDPGCACRSVDEVEAGGLDLGLGASEVRTERLELKEESNWARGRHLVLFMGPLGCSTPREQVTSNVLTLVRPPSIRAPVKREEEEPQD